MEWYGSYLEARVDRTHLSAHLAMQSTHTTHTLATFAHLQQVRPMRRQKNTVAQPTKTGIVIYQHHQHRPPPHPKNTPHASIRRRRCRLRPYMAHTTQIHYTSRNAFFASRMRAHGTQQRFIATQRVHDGGTMIVSHCLLLAARACAPVVVPGGYQRERDQQQQQQQRVVHYKNVYISTTANTHH